MLGLLISEVCGLCERSLSFPSHHSQWVFCIILESDFDVINKHLHPLVTRLMKPTQDHLCLLLIFSSMKSSVLSLHGFCFDAVLSINQGIPTFLIYKLPLSGPSFIVGVTF